MTLVYLIGVLVAVCLWMVLAWAISEQTGKSGFTDVFWTYGTGAASIFLALVPLERGEAVTPRAVLVSLLIGLWSLRLGTHILLRTLKGADDPRYAKLKRDWGRDAARRMFWFL